MADKTDKQDQSQHKKFKMPSSYTILFFLIIFVAILTWIIPAGKYATNSSGDIIPKTYHATKSNPQGLWDVFMAPVKGMVGTKTVDGAVSISLFILVIGGFLGVVNRTESLNAGISATLKKYSDSGREKILIPILMTMFAIGGSTFGMGEETIAFYPVLIAVMINMGYDSIVAISIALIGSQVGCLASTVNPFATGVASQSLHISPGQGIGSRIILFIIVVGISIAYVLKYSDDIKKNPHKSFVYDRYDLDKKEFAIKNTENMGEISQRQKSVLRVFVITFVIMILGLVPWQSINSNWTFFAKLNHWLTHIPVISVILGKDMAALGTWYFNEMTMLFFFMSVVVMFIYHMSESDYIDSFIAGMGEFLGVAIIVAVARGIQVVMDDGQITATILHSGEVGLHNLSSAAFIVLTYIFYIPMSFLIPSTSGLSAATMGIIGPLGKLSGVSADLVVTAYQAASGWVNLITPTSGVVMGALAIGHVEYSTWLKYIGKLMAVLFIVVCVFLVVCSFMKV